MIHFPHDIASVAIPVPDAHFDLIETFRYEPCCGFLRLDQHLQRLHDSAAALQFRFDEAGIREKLKKYESGDASLRIRLALAPDGNSTITCTRYEALAPAAVWSLAIAKIQLDSTDALLQHKTTRRRIYDAARAEFAQTEINEVLLTNEKGELCEGTITSLFVDMGTGTCLTPPLECGLLNGILRQELLAKGIVKEAVLTVLDLNGASKILVGNSLRGLITAKIAE